MSRGEHKAFRSEATPLMRMHTLTCFFSNWLWIYLNTAQYHRFLRTLDQVDEVQCRYLLRLLRYNAKTKYGIRHNFMDISSVKEYQQAVPITEYEDYSHYIEEIAQGETRVLTQDPVLLFEPSSGTSSGSKLIPYTGSLKMEFQRGIAPWVVSLFKRKPELLRGSAYWSISPPIVRQRYHGRMPVGFNDDAEYLGFIGRWLHAQVTAVPQEVANLTDVDAFRRQTLVYLLAAEDLAMISVWSPTFLSLLLTQLINNQDEILWLLGRSGLFAAVKRAEMVKSIMQQEQGDSLFEHIWPNLAVISCWTHGSSEPYVKEIHKYFPDVEIQGKGLVSTEAFVSLPLLPDRDPILAVDSHFFEFRDIESGGIHLAHELKEGEVYSVIVTTGGGLYRYRLGDLIKVTGFFGKTPTLRFVAKEGAISDLFGEKLHADHVQRSAADVFSACSIKPSFFLLAPVNNGTNTVAYSLFLDTAGITVEQAKFLRDTLEERLCENFHYAHCRNVGQLGALLLFLIDRASGAPEDIFIREMQRRGLKLGNVKPVILDREMGWEQRFPGRFVDAADI